MLYYLLGRTHFLKNLIFGGKKTVSVELLDFYADWCGPCKVMEPLIEEIKNEMGEKIQVKKIDVDSDNDTAMQFGVMSIPTFIVLKDGKEVDRAVGSQPKDSIVSKITAHLS